VVAGLHLLHTIADLYPHDFQWRPARESEGMLPFDRLVGTGKVRRQLDAGSRVEDIAAGWQPELSCFSQLARKYFLYE
jgi:uncharacterized protein YbbC (DUF1343 family)